MDFKKRRENLLPWAERGALVLFSGRDGHLKKFRAESSFYYFTGLNEPDAVAVLRPGHEQPFVLFLRPKDAVAELWDGQRLGVEKAPEVLNCDLSESIDDLADKLPALLEPCQRVYFAQGVDADLDQIFHDSLIAAQRLKRRSGAPRLPVFDPLEVVAELRVRKSDLELQAMRKAASASIQGHRRARAMAQPGLSEIQVYGHMVSGFYDGLAMGEGYSAIVASGANATTLHYRDNNRIMEEGDLLLIDAGAEVDFYTADITRTFPINGQFSPAQRDVYQAVLDVQKFLIQKVVAGKTSVNEMQQMACVEISKKLIDLKMLKGSVEEVVENKDYQRYYPHGIGHYLGMDVHDVGLYKRDDKPRKLEPGMVLTVEPGIYIPKNDTTVPQEMRGIGVRIEDNIHVTSAEPENLTAALEKEVSDLEVVKG